MKEQERLIDYLNVSINRCETNLSTMAMLEEVLKDFEGKQITRRIATAIQKALPDLHIIYKKMYSNFSLELYPYRPMANGARYLNKNKGMYLNLGYHSVQHDGTFSLALFKESARGYYLDKGRLEKYKKALGKAKQWSKKAKAIKDSYAALETEMEELDTHYVLESLTRLKKV